MKAMYTTFSDRKAKLTVAERMNIFEGKCLPVILTVKPWEYGGSLMSPVRSSATILQASETAATHPISTTIDSPRPNAFCTAAPPGKKQE